MTTPTACRLLIDPPGSGVWNMALDEAILESVAATGGCCWRFYRWDEPTLSLGYFQSAADRQHHAASRVCPVVRRASGGGAIVHDQELTYSFTVAADHRLAVGRAELYSAIHATLIEVLAALGVEAILWAPPKLGGSDRKPFLCFQRRAVGDVVCQGVKIAGSAQRRARGAVLQHGSVLLGRSVAAPELPGVADILGKAIDEDRLAGAWLAAMEPQLGLAFTPASLDQSQHARAAELSQEKYASTAWTLHRARGCR